MNSPFDHLRPRGWRNPQFEHSIRSPFQSSRQTIYHTFIPPQPLPLPPPIPAARSLPITYYDTNGPHYHISQYSAVHSPWNGNLGNYAPNPQHLQPDYYDSQSSVPQTRNMGYQFQDNRNPAYEPNPLYLWQSPHAPHQPVNDQEEPPVERHDEEARGRRRHARSQSRRLHSKGQAVGEAHLPLKPSTPKRGLLRAVSRRRHSEPPSEGILHSAKRISRDFLTSPWKPDRDDKVDLEKQQYEDQNRMGSSQDLRTHKHRQASRPTTPSPKSPRRPTNSTKCKTSHPMHIRRPSEATGPQKVRRVHRTGARNHRAQQVSQVQASDTEDTIGGRPRSGSDLSDLDGNMEISKMNGLLDIWDSAGNPNWEKETFALCDLEYCRRCGKYYALMKTLRHHCRR